MSLFDANVGGGGVQGFDFEAWFKATTADAVASNSSITWTGSDGVGRIACQIDDTRNLHIVPDSSGYPVAQVISPSAVGSPVVMVSNVESIIDLVPVAGTNRYAIAISTSNDLYIIDCGASGTTATVTAKTTEAGDASYAEAFIQSVTRILCDASTHFVICNQFDDAGTRKFVSALYTLNLGVPSATYVTRDTDADGGSHVFQGGVAYNTETLGSGVFFAGTASASTDIRVNKITHTSSTVANAVTTVSSVPTITSFSGVGNTGKSSNLPDSSSALIGYNASRVLIDYSGTPSLVASCDSATGSQSSAAVLDGVGTVAVGVQGTANTTVAIQFMRAAGQDPLAETRNLVTGETASVAIGLTSITKDKGYIYMSGKHSTNTGRVYRITKPAS